MRLTAQFMFGLLILVAGVLLPVPYVRLSPGPVYDALSDVDGEPVVSVTGVTQAGVAGGLDGVEAPGRGGHPRGRRRGAPRS